MAAAAIISLRMPSLPTLICAALLIAAAKAVKRMLVGKSSASSSQMFFPYSVRPAAGIGWPEPMSHLSESTAYRGSKRGGAVWRAL